MPSNLQNKFLSIIRAGLWERETKVSPSPEDWPDLYHLAASQSVLGLVTAGLEHVADVPSKARLPFINFILQLEAKNKEMNAFIGPLMQRLKEADIEALLVKGQGIAQCYERPLWRACGDVDLFLSQKDYEAAKAVLEPLAQEVEPESEYNKHAGYIINGWCVELHGTLRNCLGKKMDNVIDSVQKDVFEGQRTQVWKNGDYEVLTPAPDENVVLIFMHILQHFFKGGIGLRQICDWCRLLWTYRDSLNLNLLEERLNQAGVLPQWRSFAALAVNYLGMPEAAMPFYSAAPKWQRKAKRILAFIFETGNFGRNRDTSYTKRYPYLLRKVVSLWRHTSDSIKHFFIFPRGSARIWFLMLRNGISAVLKGR